jgi:predicted ATPase/class 3 adenylate cyclase/Tfp pilus assembly protein PilF
MSAPPTGTITFLFTDIQGSTRLWEQHPQAMETALDRHNTLVREAIEVHGGYVFKTVGDAFCTAFSVAPEALAAAVAVQRALIAEFWGETGRLRVRIALHTGTAGAHNGDYTGFTLSRVARILAAGHGDQILLSRVTEELISDQLPPDVTLRDLGTHQLKDLSRPEYIFQVLAPGLPERFPPLKTLERRASNLPAQMTPLIGRVQEAAAACALLRRPDVRLLNLLGPGGTGKTRLGLQVASDMLDEFESGIYFVGLTPISVPALVASTIAQTLGLKEGSGQPVAESLKDFLREKHLLLLLDNFEQVVDAAPLLADLLAAAPRLKMLITSRAVLHLTGEHAFPVPPLALPDSASLQSTSADVVSTLSHYTAVELFIQRAQAVKPDFQVTTSNAAAVAEICARLDGLPLAIELAAARVKLFPPQALLARLSSRLKLLVGGGQDRPARQQTLRSAIDWSYDLLDTGEQALFRRMGVFAGGGTVESAESVLRTEGRGLREEAPISVLSPQYSVLDGLASLVDKSLLRQEVGPDDEPRFTMLETIREYALERIDMCGETAVLQRQHAVYFLELAERAEPELYGAEQRVWLERLEAEHDNLRAALAWSRQELSMKNEELKTGAADESFSILNSQFSTPQELGLRLAAALWVFWWKRGYFSEGRTWLTGALERADTRASMAARAKALHGAGSLALEQHDFEPAAELLEAGLALYQEIGDKRGCAWAISELGHLALYQGDDERAATRYAEGLALSRELGDTYNSAWALNHLGTVALRSGTPEQAREQLEQSLELFQTLRHTAGIATVLNQLGRVALRSGDIAKARTLFEESLTIFQELGQKRNIALSLVGLAVITSQENQAELAARMFGAAERLLNDIGAVLDPADRAEYDRGVASVRAQIDPAAFAAAWEAGRTVPLEDVISSEL